MKKLFEKEVYDNPVELHIVSRFSDSAKFTKPKELKGINPIGSVKCRRKTLQLFIDKDYNLWYKDNNVILSWESEIVDNKEIQTYVNMDKIWFKFTGIYERRNAFILDILREMCEVSDSIYTDNTVSSNIALEDIYLHLLEMYLNHINK